VLRALTLDIGRFQVNLSVFIIAGFVYKQGYIEVSLSVRVQHGRDRMRRSCLFLLDPSIILSYQPIPVYHEEAWKCDTLSWNTCNVKFRLSLL
jgi:hypothetical protein